MLSYKFLCASFILIVYITKTPDAIYIEPIALVDVKNFDAHDKFIGGLSDFVDAILKKVDKIIAHTTFS